MIFLAFSSLISKITTLDPLETNSSTVACPKPDAPPVTSAIESFNSIKTP